MELNIFIRFDIIGFDRVPRINEFCYEWCCVIRQEKILKRRVKSISSSGFPFKLYFARHRENLFTSRRVSLSPSKCISSIVFLPPLSFPEKSRRTLNPFENERCERKRKSETSIGAAAILSNPFNSILLILCSPAWMRFLRVSFPPTLSFSLSLSPSPSIRKVSLEFR